MTERTDEDGVDDQPTIEKPTVAAPSDVSGDETPAADTPGRRRRDIAFGLATVVLVLCMLELLLRVLGFRFEPVPMLFDITWGKEQVEAMNVAMGKNIFCRDDLLFWSLKSGARLDTRTVNRFGLLNGPVEIPKPKGTYRLLCLGDSCTAMGPVPYSMSLQNRLKAVERPDRRCEVINAGCFGYSSFQGRRQFRNRLGDFAPDLVTVYYGWNDHYLTAGYPDKMLRSRNSPVPGTVRMLRRFRIYQLVQKVVNTAQMKTLDRQREGKRLVRVEPEDYRANIRAIVDLARSRGARVLLLTAPSNHRPGNVAAYFIENRLAKSEAALIAQHRRYNEIVRDVAAEKKAELLDLVKAFDARDKDHLFAADGLHPNRRGCQLIGRLLVAKMGEMGVLSPEERRRIAEHPAYDSLDPNLLRSRVRFDNTPLRVQVARPLDLAVAVTNAGDTLWLARSDPVYGQVKLGTIIHDSQGKRLFERERGLLPHDVRPGETVQIRWRLSPLTRPGRYVLEVDPVAEFVTWFNEAGDERTTTSLIVEPAPVPVQNER